ncbi:MAG TPA: dipeptidase PepV [Clostridiales bacterium]|nr:dipeptidase PepV [Clostridiales bacterium]
MDIFLNKYREEIISSLKEFIKIPSVISPPRPGAPFGPKVAKALDYVLNLGDSMGFEVKNLDGYAGHVQYGEGDEILGILTHVDVVPAGSGWTYPPFEGQVHDNRIYGRGAVDDKGPGIAALYALLALKEQGFMPQRTIRIIYGANEENDWECVNYYFSREKMPQIGLAFDGSYPVINGEKGVLVIHMEKDIEWRAPRFSIEDIKGGTAANAVPDYCCCTIEIRDQGLGGEVADLQRAFVEDTGYDVSITSMDGGRYRVESRGQPAHGSTPEKGKNAIGRLFKFLHFLDSGDEHLNEVLFHIGRLAMDHNGRDTGLFVKDEVSGSMTVNVGIVGKNNQAIYLKVNTRYPVTYSMDRAVEDFTRMAEGLGYKCKVENRLEPLYVKEDSYIINILKDIYQKTTGQPPYAFTIGGATYARALKNGVAFGPTFPGRPELAHQRDEYMDIQDLMTNIKIYTEAMMRLSMA